MAVEADTEKKAAVVTEEAKEAKEEAKEETKDETKEDAKADPEKKEGLKPKEPVKPKELEEDAAEETRPKISAGTAGVNLTDSTLNAMLAGNGKCLMSVMEGGFQYLLAGARTNIGIKSGRYLIEAKIMESHKAPQTGGQAPMPRNLVRLGVSLAGTSLFLGDGSSDNLCFDSEGFFLHDKNRKKVTQKSEKDSVMGLLINLDEGSPNANTISFFRNGVRACEPQPIPEAFRGKPLIPTITYKNVTVNLHSGSSPLAPLPFKCHMVADAANADVEVSAVPEPKGGKHEVVFPVGLPAQGYFDWVDAFLKQNPDFTELSDRKILDWAAMSGLGRPKTLGNSLDKPDMKFSVPHMDDASISKLLLHLAPTARRNIVVPELKANLVAAERQRGLARFPAADFRRTAAVMVGEPTAEFKEQVHGLILADKKRVAEGELKMKREEEARKKLFEERKKQGDAARAKAQAALKRKREGLDAVEEEAEEEKAEEPKEEPMEVEVELTDEEKALWFRKTLTPDVSEQVLAKFYADFTFPTSDEGFDEVSYKWESETDAAKKLKNWIFAKKLTQRVEDLQPGTWFKEEWQKWTKALQEWRKTQGEWKDPIKKKALLAKKVEAKKKEMAETGDETTEYELPKVDPEEIEVLSVEDVNDIGSGEPLYANFQFEDWTMLAARYELHLLLCAFKKDLDDADRPSFTSKDLPFYFNKYFKKPFNIRTFNMDKVEALVELIKETVKISDATEFLEYQQAEDVPIASFVKFAEDHRRERQRRMDAGDETAELKFPRVPSGAPPPRPGMAPGAGARLTPGLVPRGAAVPTAAAGQKRPLAPAAGVGSAYVAKRPNQGYGGWR